MCSVRRTRLGIHSADILARIDNDWNLELLFSSPSFLAARPSQRRQAVFLHFFLSVQLSKPCRLEDTLALSLVGGGRVSGDDGVGCENDDVCVHVQRCRMTEMKRPRKKLVHILEYDFLKSISSVTYFYCCLLLLLLLRLRER